MADIEGRKYQVQLPSGEWVSRQRAHQIQHPESYKAHQKRYLQSDKGKERAKAWQLAWNQRYLEEHGETYATYYYRTKIKGKKKKGD